MKKKSQIKWLDQPASKDYLAAGAYLELLFDTKAAQRYVKRLKRAKVAKYHAKDILRASGTSLLDIKAYDWTKQKTEIQKDMPLSPILLVKKGNGSQLVVADGFHRLCAVFSLDEQAIIPCKLV